MDLALTADTSLALPLLVTELRGLATPQRTARWRARRPEVTGRLEGVRQRWAGLRWTGAWGAARWSGWSGRRIWGVGAQRPQRGQHLLGEEG